MATSPPVTAWRPLLLVHKSLLLVAAILAMWMVGAGGWSMAVGLPVISYLALTVVCLAMSQMTTRFALTLHAVALAVDSGLIIAIIIATGGLNSPFWILFALQAWLPAFYLPWSWLTWLIAFLSGPLYVLALWLHGGALAFLIDPLFLVRYGLLFLSAIAAAVAGAHMQHTRRRMQTLADALATREADLETQTRRLQRTAADLGDRVLQLRSLQETARALASTRDLPQTLQVLVDHLAALADAQHAAIALLEDEGETLNGVAASGPNASAIQQFTLDLHARPADAARLAAGNIVASTEGDVLGFRRLQALWGADRSLCLPVVLRGQPIGALYLAGARLDIDAERQRQLLDSFAYFAAAAIDNAQLYQAVADKSRELEAILSGIGDGVLVVDDDLRLVLMNPVAARIFGLETTPPAGLPAHLLLESAEFLSLLAEVKLDPNTALIREVELTPAHSNSPRTFQALATPLLEGSNLQGIATVLRDFTAQKELERMKSNFMSVVSHELKTPMHSIKGFVDIILMGKTGPVTEIQRDFLETVKQQTNHLQRMIDDLLEFSRLESGRVTLRLQPVDIPVVVEAALDKLAPQAVSSQVTLVNQTLESLPTIMADPWRLEQVMTNLADNAIKFTPAGGSVTVRSQDQGDYLQISVQDTGIGIEPGELERIFERFYQVDGGVNRKYKGTGLGLTICRHIVEHHGGAIWAESELGKGATFSFTIYKHLQPAGMGALDFTTSPQNR